MHRLTRRLFAARVVRCLPSAGRYLSGAAPPPSNGDAGGGAPPPPPRAPPSRWYLLREDFTDVLSVTFGFERKRNVEEEYDLGVRAYPWVTYTDAATQARLYRNTDTGVVTPHKPLDFDKRATAASFKITNEAATAVMRVAPGLTPWERTLRALGATPLIQSLLSAGEAVKQGPVGQAAARVGARVSEVREDLQEKWETSQHPLVVNTAYVVDSLYAETEQGRALRDIRLLDAGFDEYSFVAEMREAFIPVMSRAFFRLDHATLAAHCRPTAMAQMRAVAAAREAEGLEHDGTILQVSKVELLKAQQIEDAKGGTTPLLLVSAHVQYIHAVRDKTGTVVEGSDSEIRLAMFIIALTREFEPERGTLAWKAVEVAMHGSQLYL